MVLICVNIVKWWPPSNTARRIGLTFFSESRVAVYFDNSTDDAELVYNNDQYLFLRFSRIVFVGTSLNSICHYSYSTGGAQDCFWEDCSWEGYWKSTLKLAGTNSNSEFGWMKCAHSVRCQYLWDFNGSDQFLNYWADMTKFWLYTGVHINSVLGGHYKFINCDWSGIGTESTAPYILFNLSGSNHSRGVCDFRIINGRFEMHSTNTALLNCEWNYGIVELNIDMSSQASAALGAVTMFTFSKNNTQGTKLLVHDSMLCGQFIFNYQAGSQQYQPTVCRIYDSQVFFTDIEDMVSLVQTGTASNSQAGSYAVELDGISTNDLQYVPGQVTYHINDRTIAPNNYAGLSKKERSAWITGFDGRLPMGGANFKAIFPIGSRITRVKWVAPSAGSSAVASYSLNTGDGITIDSIAGVLNTDSSKDTFISGNAVLLSSSNNTLVVTDNNDISVDGPGGGCIVYYEPW